MNSQDPRAEVRILQDEIDQLNHEKDPLKKALDAESYGKGLVDQLRTMRNPPAPLKRIQEINVRLAFLYGQRNAILEAYPALQREFGKPASESSKRFCATDRLETAAARTADDRHKRKAKMHPAFKAWCAAQKPQIKCSLENWEKQGIRAAFQKDLASKTQAPENKAADQQTAKAQHAPTPGQRMPDDFQAFLTEMDHPLASWSQARREDLWLSDKDQRELYALWREERAETKTPT